MGAKLHHIDRWAQTALRAYSQGAVVRSASRLYWDVAGNGRLACHKPVTREFVGRKPARMSPDMKHAKVITESRVLELDVRCRRCHACLEHRKLYWRALARNEIAGAARTWFATLTVDPQHQVQAAYRAGIRLAKSGIDFDSLDREKQFAERVAEIAPEITKWLKRVRKEASVNLRQKARDLDGCTASRGKSCRCHKLFAYTVPLRYLLVVEEHTGGGAHHGLPHFHLLIHELDDKYPVRHEVLASQWKLGNTRFKLVDADEGEKRKFANYVTKYLTKSILCRARASQKYGQTGASYLRP